MGEGSERETARSITFVFWFKQSKAEMPAQKNKIKINKITTKTNKTTKI